MTTDLIMYVCPHLAYRCRLTLNKVHQTRIRC